MSTKANQSGSQAISAINFGGGLPSSVDFAPSIVFLIAFAMTIPLFVFRVIRKQDRTAILIRPAIFVQCRLGMLAIRAYMSKNSYGEGLLIAEFVLVSFGYLFLIDSFVAIWKRHLGSVVDAKSYPAWVAQLARILRLTLLAAIITAIAGAAMISSALNDPSQLSTVKDLRTASVCLSLAVIVILNFAICVSHHRFNLNSTRSAYLLGACVCMFIVAIFRVVQNFSNNPDAPVRSKAAFWILQITFEFFAYIPIIAVSIPTFYPVITDGESRLRDMEMGAVSSGPK